MGCLFVRVGLSGLHCGEGLQSTPSSATPATVGPFAALVIILAPIATPPPDPDGSSNPRAELRLLLLFVSMLSDFLAAAVRFSHGVV